MSDSRQNVTELNDESTREEIVAYIRNKPPLFTKSVVIDGMCICMANPALVELDDDGNPVSGKVADSNTRLGPEHPTFTA